MRLPLALLLSCALLACRSEPPPPAPPPAAAATTAATATTAASPARSAPAATSAAGAATPAGSFFQFSAPRLDGQTESLATYRGKVILVVNTASQCGYTPQYEGLQALHQKYESKGFTVLGFPSNDFGGQEPGSSSEIATFCQSKYGVSFPMFAKVETKGAGASPIYKFLSATAGAPQWNFHKYLVGKNGQVRQGFPSAIDPASAALRTAIEAALAEPG